MSSPLFTCVACESAFASAEAQREHFKLEWHRYNLKRKVAGLAPSKREDFEARLAAAAGAQAPRPPFKGFCAECRKSFSSESLYNQHLASKRHRQALQQLAKKRPATVINGSELAAELDEAAAAAAAAAADPAALKDAMEPETEAGVSGSFSAMVASGESGAAIATAAHGVAALSRPTAMAVVESDAEQEEGEENAEGMEQEQEDVPLGAEACVFCDHESADVEANCRHMLQRHGFFVPDAEYLVDAAGLIAYLNEKVKLGGLCLYCNGHGKGFHSRRAVQQHMADASHCKVLYEEGEDLHEFEPFYDFSASYAVDEGGSDGIVEVVRRRKADDGSSGSEDGSGGGESVEESDGDSDDESVVVKRTMHVTDLGELALLDGRVVGHRDLRVYYKQNIRYEDGRDAVVAQRQAQQQRILAMYGEAGCKTGSSRALRLAGRLSLPRGAPTAAVRATRAAGGVARRRDDRVRLKTEISQNKLNRTYRKVHEC